MGLEKVGSVAASPEHSKMCLDCACPPVGSLIRVLATIIDCLKYTPNEFGDEKHFSLSCTPFQDDRYHVQKNKLILSQVKESES